jgi:hypothetical protein
MLSTDGWRLVTNFGNAVVSALGPLINCHVRRTLSPQVPSPKTHHYKYDLVKVYLFTIKPLVSKFQCFTIFSDGSNNVIRYSIWK